MREKKWNDVREENTWNIKRDKSQSQRQSICFFFYPPINSDFFSDSGFYAAAGPKLSGYNSAATAI